MFEVVIIHSTLGFNTRILYPELPAIRAKKDILRHASSKKLYHPHTSSRIVNWKYFPATNRRNNAIWKIEKLLCEIKSKQWNQINTVKPKWLFPNVALKFNASIRHYTRKDNAAAKSLQSCLTLCDPIDGSPPGSPVPGILQARTLEWVAISFSNAWRWKVQVKSFSRVRLFTTPWTAAY